MDWQQHHQGDTPQSPVEEEKGDRKMKKTKNVLYASGKPMKWALKGIPDSNAPIPGTESTGMAGRDSEPSQESP
jgi:hypothetical protein